MNRDALIELAVRPKNCYKILFYLFGIFYALYFISGFSSNPPFFYAEYNPSAKRIGERTDRFPCGFGNFILGFLNLEVIPFDTI